MPTGDQGRGRTVEGESSARKKKNSIMEGDLLAARREEATYGPSGPYLIVRAGPNDMKKNWK